MTLPLVPFLYSERLVHSRRRSEIGRYAAVAKGPRILRSQWHGVAARAEREGLRRVAHDSGVSHETVRAIVTRVRQETASSWHLGSSQMQDG